MRVTCNKMLGVVFAICIALPASGQEAVGVPSPKPANPVQTGKERLGRKWMDEQRIDNCKVPVDKRGTKPRPATCAPPQQADRAPS